MSPDQPFSLPGAPAIPGLHYRRLDPGRDFPAMSRVHNLAACIDNPQFQPQSAEALARELTPGSPEQVSGVLIAEMNGKMVAWGNCGLYRQRANLWVGYHDFYILPEWRGRGIEPPALRYFEAHVSEMRQACPAEEAIYKIFVNETDTYWVGQLESAGYTCMAAHANMVRPNLEDIPDHPLPQGIQIRPAAPEHLREIYEAYRDAFREHIHGTDPSDEDFEEWSHADYLSDRSLWVVAWDVQAERIAGVILNFILEDENAFHNRKRGYVEFISVPKPYRRLGLARAMISASLRQYKQRGMQEAALSCHTENPFNPISLYLEMGFQTRFHTLVYTKPIPRL